MSSVDQTQTSYLCPRAALEVLKKCPLNLPSDLTQTHDFFKIGAFFNSLVKKAEESKDEPLAHSYFLLGHTVHLAFVVSDAENPFKFPISSSQHPPSPLSDFKPEHLEILKWAVELPFKDHHPLVARFADVLWVRLRDANYARQALSAYIQHTKDVVRDDIADIFECHLYLKRACQIWKMLGSDATIKNDLFQTCVACLNLQAPEPPNYTRLAFIDVMKDFDLFDDHKKWLEFSENKVSECMSLNHFDGARNYAECAIAIAQRLKDTAKERTLKEKLADTYTDEFRKMQASGASAMILQNKVSQAIEANRQLGGRKQKNDLLHLELNALQTASLAEMKEISVPFDAKDLVESSLKLIKDQNLYDSLMRIAAKAAPPVLKEMKVSAAKTLKDFPLQSLIPTSKMSEKGRMVAKTDGGTSNSEEDESNLLLTKAMEHFVVNVAVNGLAINYMRQALIDRGETPNQAIDKLLELNPFVPLNHREQIKTGLIHGYCGRWIEALHILLPQIENSVRNLFELNGVLVTSLSSSHIQNDHNLNILLYAKYEGNAVAIFGEDIHFALKALLVDKLGLNLRNEIMHGLKGDRNFEPNIGAYVWAFFLFLCFAIAPAKE